MNEVKNNTFTINTNENFLDISLVIDENNITHIEINPNDLSEIRPICQKVCNKYNLEGKIKDKLEKEIRTKISDIQKGIIGKKKFKAVDTVNRLYYESIERNKEKEAFLKAIRQDQENIMLSNLSFSPHINKMSNLLYERNYAKIQDKLYNDFKIIRERKDIKRILNDVDQKSSHNFNNSYDYKKRINLGGFNSTTNKSQKKIKIFDLMKTNSMEKSSKIEKNKNRTIKHINNRNDILIDPTIEHNSKNKFVKIKDRILEYNPIKSENNYIYSKANDFDNKHFETKEKDEKKLDLNLNDLSHINKNKNYDTEESLGDSYLNLKPIEHINQKLHFGYDTATQKNFANNNNSQFNNDFKPFLNAKDKKSSIFSMKLPSAFAGYKALLQDMSLQNNINYDLLAKTPAFFKNIESILGSTVSLNKRNTIPSNQQVLLAELAKKFSINVNNNTIEKKSYMRNYKKSLTTKNNTSLRRTSNASNMNPKLSLCLNQANNQNNINLNDANNNYTLKNKQDKQDLLNSSAAYNRHYYNLNMNLNLNNSGNLNNNNTNTTINNNILSYLNNETINTSPCISPIDNNTKKENEKNFSIKLCNNNTNNVNNKNNYTSINTNVYSSNNNANTNPNTNTNSYSFKNRVSFKKNSNAMNHNSDLKLEKKDSEKKLNLNPNNLKPVSSFKDNIFDKEIVNANNHFNINFEIRDSIKKDSLNYQGQSEVLSSKINLTNNKENQHVNISGNNIKLRLSNYDRSNLNLKKSHTEENIRNYNNLNNPNAQESKILDFSTLKNQYNPSCSDKDLIVFQMNNLPLKADKNFFTDSVKNEICLTYSNNNTTTNLVTLNNNNHATNSNYSNHIKNKNVFHDENKNGSNFNHQNSKNNNINKFNSKAYIENKRENVLLNSSNSISNSQLNTIANINSHAKNKNNLTLKSSKFLNFSKNKHSKSNHIKSKSLEIHKVKVNNRYLINYDRGNRDIHSYLYDIGKDSVLFKQKFTKEIFDKIYTFKPEISNKSLTLIKNKIKNNENKQDFYQRLTDSKRINKFLIQKKQNLERVSKTVSNSQDSRNINLMQKKNHSESSKHYNKTSEKNTSKHSYLEKQKKFRTIDIANLKQKFTWNNNATISTALGPHNYKFANLSINADKNIQLNNIQSNKKNVNSISTSSRKIQYSNTESNIISPCFNHNDCNLLNHEKSSTNNEKIFNSNDNSQDNLNDPHITDSAGKNIPKMNKSKYKPLENYLNSSQRLFDSNIFTTGRHDNKSSKNDLINYNNNHIASNKLMNSNLSNNTFSIENNLLSSNDFKISNSKLLTQQSRHIMPTDDDFIYSSNNNNNKQDKNLLNLSVNEMNLEKENILNQIMQEENENEIDSLNENNSNHNCNQYNYNINHIQNNTQTLNFSQNSFAKHNTIPNSDLNANTKTENQKSKLTKNYKYDIYSNSCNNFYPIINFENYKKLQNKQLLQQQEFNADNDDKIEKKNNNINANSTHSYDENEEDLNYFNNSNTNFNQDSNKNDDVQYNNISSNIMTNNPKIKSNNNIGYDYEAEGNSQQTFIVHTTNSNFENLNNIAAVNNYTYSINNKSQNNANSNSFSNYKIYNKNEDISTQRKSENYKNLNSSESHNKKCKDSCVRTKQRDGKKLREIKEEENLFGQINDLKKQKEKQGELLRKRYSQHIDKLKMNSLKEIYEIVEKNYYNIQKISEFGISDFIIQHLVFPVISIIQKRQMELNFKNFHSLALHFLNRAF